MRALALYRELPLRVRLLARVRGWTTPHKALVIRLPEHGRLLEIGCGLGLFANEAALHCPELDVLGIDAREAPIRWAQTTVGEREGVVFRQGRLEPGEDGFDVLVGLDVLSLASPGEWHDFFAACFLHLCPGGRVMIKEVARGPAWKRAVARAQDEILRRLGLRTGKRLSFTDVETIRGLMHGAGFWDVSVTLLGSGSCTSHVLYEGIRPE